MESLINAMNNIPHTDNAELIAIQLTPEEAGVRDCIGECPDYHIQSLKESGRYDVLFAEYLLEYPDNDYEDFEYDLEEYLIQEDLNNPDYVMNIMFWSNGDEDIMEVFESYIATYYESETGYCAEINDLDLDNITEGMNINLVDISYEDPQDMDCGCITI